MGSYQARDLAFTHPDYYKALACVSGMVNVKLASRITFPLLIIHGGSGIIDPVADATTMADRLKSLNMALRLTCFS